MKTGITAAAGQRVGNLSCCGRPMRNVDSGIWECSRCDCWVTSDDGVIAKVSPCGSH